MTFVDSKWGCFEVAADWLYQTDLFEAEQHFFGLHRDRPAAGRRSRAARSGRWASPLTALLPLCVSAAERAPLASYASHLDAL